VTKPARQPLGDGAPDGEDLARRRAALVVADHRTLGSMRCPESTRAAASKASLCCSTTHPVRMIRAHRILGGTEKSQGLTRGVYINGVYTQTYNRRHHKVGHLFQGGTSKQSWWTGILICWKSAATWISIRCAPA